MNDSLHITASDFVGSFPVTIDAAKGRVKIPVEFLRVLKQRYATDGDTVCCCISLDRNVDIFPESEWNVHVERLASGASVFDRLSRSLSTLVQMTTSKSDIDKQGRLKLSPSLLEKVGMGKSAMLCGFTGRMELWPIDKYNEFIERSLKELGENQDQLKRERSEFKVDS